MKVGERTMQESAEERQLRGKRVRAWFQLGIISQLSWHEGHPDIAFWRGIFDKTIESRRAISAAASVET
jgi:hypothetical protein